MLGYELGSLQGRSNFDAAPLLGLEFMEFGRRNFDALLA